MGEGRESCEYACRLGRPKLYILTACCSVTISYVDGYNESMNVE
jgi:hypothetical protein